MSSAPRDARSFEPIDVDDLNTLAAIALRRLDSFFARRPDRRAQYKERLLGICLCQGAADHYLASDKQSGAGVHDFDLWAFYRMREGLPFWNRAPSTADFGPSKFGRSPYDPRKYTGRRVDVLWRAIDARAEETAHDAIRRYFAEPRTESAHALRKKAAVLIWPACDAGVALWSPTPPGSLREPPSP